jgi:MFS superfamily sulfate permease-like transporter
MLPGIHEPAGWKCQVIWSSGCQMLRTITWLAVVGVLLVWLSARPVVPGWLLAIGVAAAIVLGFEASTKQKRMERDIVRAGWRRLTKRT